jgi:hypothetical protein
MMTCFSASSAGLFEEQSFKRYSPWIEQNLKEIIRKEPENIPAKQLQRVNQNILQCEEYVYVDWQHFEHLLCSVNCNYFVPNMISQQAHQFIGKICIEAHCCELIMK